MSGWGFGWFGGNSAQRPDAPKKAILKLREQLEMLSKRERHLENQMNEQDALARKLVNTNKNAAKAALKRKKAFEQAYEQTQGQIMNLEQQVHGIETANINKETLDAMQSASQAMKHIHSGLTVEKVDNIMENLRDQHAISQEINAAITDNAGSTAIDESELDDELEALQQEVLDDRMLATGQVPVADKVSPALPNAPVKKPVVEDEEEEEIRKLQAEMNL